MLSRLFYSRFGKFIKRRLLIDNFSNFCHYNFIIYFYSWLFTYNRSYYYTMEVFRMTIKDDIKAINKDIFEAKDWEQMVQRTKYWVVKLKNIYPDYKF